MGMMLVLPSPLFAQEAKSALPVKELRQTFEQGCALYQEGQYTKAIGLFEKNLAVDAASKGSLLFSGLAFLELSQFEKAVERFDRFLQLEPLNESGLIGAIKANQALNRMNEVDRLRQMLLQQRSSVANPRLKAMQSYERQMMPLHDGSRFSILENLDAKGAYVWVYLLLGSDRKTVKRRLELAPVPAGVSDGKFLLGEARGGDSHTTGYKIHRLYAVLPGFEKARSDAMAAMDIK